MVVYCCYRRRARSLMKTRETDSETSRYSANYSQGSKTVVVSSFDPVTNNRADQLQDHQYRERPQNATTPPLLNASTRNSSLGRNSNQSSSSTSGVSSQIMDQSGRGGYSPNHTMTSRQCAEACCSIIPEEMCYLEAQGYHPVYNLPPPPPEELAAAEYRMRNASGAASDNSLDNNVKTAPYRAPTQYPPTTTSAYPLYPHHQLGYADMYPMTRSTPYIPVTSQYPGRYADTSRHMRTEQGATSAYHPTAVHTYEGVVM